MRRLLVLLVLFLPAAPAAAQDGCGKLYQGADCTDADYQRALDRMQDAAKPPPVPADAPPGPPPAEDLRATALRNWEKMVRDRQPAGMQCCHPSDMPGEMWCH